MRRTCLLRFLRSCSAFGNMSPQIFTLPLVSTSVANNKGWTWTLSHDLKYSNKLWVYFCILLCVLFVWYRLVQIFLRKWVWVRDRWTQREGEIRGCSASALNYHIRLLYSFVLFFVTLIFWYKVNIKKMGQAGQVKLLPQMFVTLSVTLWSANSDIRGGDITKPCVTFHLKTCHRKSLQMKYSGWYFIVVT